MHGLRQSWAVTLMPVMVRRECSDFHIGAGVHGGAERDPFTPGAERCRLWWHSGSMAKFKAELEKAKHPWGSCEGT